MKRGRQVKVLFDTISLNIINDAVIYTLCNNDVSTYYIYRIKATIRTSKSTRKQLNHQILCSPIHNKSTSNTLDINLQNISYFTPATFLQAK